MQTRTMRIAALLALGLAASGPLAAHGPEDRGADAQARLDRETLKASQRADGEKPVTEAAGG